jgi:hypothetical protein
MSKRSLLLLVGCWMLFASATASAHSRSESYSNWRINGDRVTGVVTISTGEIVPLLTPGKTGSLSDVFVDHLRASTKVSSESAPCELKELISLAAARGFERAELHFSCAGGIPTSLRYRALFDTTPAHVHYARVFDDDVFVAEVLLTDSADTWTRNASNRAVTPSFTKFLNLGMRHILGGADHFAFLLGMLLVAGTFGRSVIAVTGFTLGHSISLAAAVLGYLSADGRLVEAFIGFTVALIAVEYFLMHRPSAKMLAYFGAITAWLTGYLAWQFDLISIASTFAYLGFGVFAFCYLRASVQAGDADKRLGNAVLFTATACFGVVHGFGFAGFLMATGISGISLLQPLLGFNLGVEIGQLALIAIAFIAAFLLSSLKLHLAAPLVAASLCGVGLFWFVSRSLAG